MSAWPPRDEPDTGPVRRASVREMQQIWRARPARVTEDDQGTLQLNAGGYGYGLGISQSCAFAHIVAHSGGLPGYGSIMRWLPEHGVGIIALGNLTYTSWGTPVTQAFDALARTGGLQPRAIVPSADLVGMKEAVSRLVVSWDDLLADSIAAMNLFLDESKERRKLELDELRRSVGECRTGGELEPENALRGRWTMPCDRGFVRVAITLAPTVPPRVQFLDVRRVEQGDRGAAAAACAVTRG
jgi:hypothetical protein